MANNPHVGFRLEKELRMKLLEIADLQGRTLSNLIQYIIKQYVTEFYNVNSSRVVLRKTERKGNPHAA